MASPRSVLQAFGVVLAVALLGAACTASESGGDGGDGGGTPASGGGSGGATGGAAVTGGAGSGAGANGGSAGSGTGGLATGGGGQSAGGTSGSAGVSGAAGVANGGVSGSGGSGGAAGGAAGTPTAGSAGSSVAGAGGAEMGSPGCGMAVTQTARMWVEATPLDVNGAMRRWWTYLPNNYEPMRRYPVIYLFHGCGNETNNVNMQNIVGENAILVRGKAVSDCWVTSANSEDIAFFDALVMAVEARYCADTTRRFAVGYSSGSWLINTLECVRGGVLRAAASVAGGGSSRNCTGPSLARLFIHDLNDMDNAISGNITERDRLLMVNGCNASAPVAEDPAPCVRYQGCMPGLPVIWCETMGQGHARQDQLASTAAWGLFTEF